MGLGHSCDQGSDPVHHRDNRCLDFWRHLLGEFFDFLDLDEDDADVLGHIVGKAEETSFQSSTESNGVRID